MWVLVFPRKLGGKSGKGQVLDQASGRLIKGSQVKGLLSNTDCACFVRNGIYFLHCSYYGAVLWICGHNSADNTGMFQ